MGLFLFICRPERPSHRVGFAESSRYSVESGIENLCGFCSETLWMRPEVSGAVFSQSIGSLGAASGTCFFGFTEMARSRADSAMCNIICYDGSLSCWQGPDFRILSDARLVTNSPALLRRHPNHKPVQWLERMLSKNSTEKLVKICSPALLLFLFGVFQFENSFLVDATAQEPVAQEPAIHSEPVSLGNGDYVLVCKGKMQLLLEHRGSDGTSVRQVQPHTLQSEDVSRKTAPFLTGRNDKITEIALARWSKRSLVAVVKVVDGQDVTFWCLTFAQARSFFEKSDEPMQPTVALLTKGSHGDRILALSGSRNSPTITAVIGKFSNRRPGAIDSGRIAIHGCPNPGAIDARVGTFIPEYEPRDYDR